MMSQQNVRTCEKAGVHELSNALCRVRISKAMDAARAEGLAKGRTEAKQK